MTEDEFERLVARTESAFQFGAWLRTPESATVIWSPGIYSLLGLHPSVRPSFDLLTMATHPSDRPILARNLRYSRDSATVEVSRFRIRRSDQTHLSIESYVRCLDAAPDRPRQQLGVWLDSSERGHAHSIVRQVLEAFGGMDPRDLPLAPSVLENGVVDLAPEGSLDMALVRAARSLLGWSGEDFAEASGLSYSTIRRAESNDLRRPSAANLATLRRTLERQGIRFIRSGQAVGVIRLPAAS